jgi:hypothetical protein
MTVDVEAKAKELAVVRLMEGMRGSLFSIITIIPNEQKTVADAK